MHFRWTLSDFFIHHTCEETSVFRTSCLKHEQPSATRVVNSQKDFFFFFFFGGGGGGEDRPMR